ncbi:hypothetical protein FC756_16125 [Lysinibacillus mangiferihumi]|uniref:Uncharacterized protein n=1 Tax=Lysinibacillus mangiferihumi TaxID=1130819 RepID=A0A4U2YWY6_9BACI|nr:hypothetical protein [Lysinibacillus mangiferihumi]TKI65575.1 hypothetical protein FC756_16125 [Lysinibacillus mangiferihumi]
MSFISAVAMENFVTVVADGRQSKPETKEIISENFIKVRGINDKQFIALTGDVGVAEAVFSKFSGGLFYDLKNSAELIRDELVKKIDLKLAKCNGVLGGRNQLNEIVLYTFSNDPNLSIDEYKPKASVLSNVMLSSDELTKKGFNANAAFEKIYQAKKPRTLDDVISVQAELNDIVSDLDISVNKEKTILIIT